MSVEFDYDPTTDSLYVELRPGESRRQPHDRRRYVIDIGIDGEPVGYDIQHAAGTRSHAEALFYLHRRRAASRFVPRLRRSGA